MSVDVICVFHILMMAQNGGKINPICATSSTGSEEHIDQLSFSQWASAGKLGAESHGTCPRLASVCILCIRIVIGTVVETGSVEPRSDLLGVGEVAHGVVPLTLLIYRKRRSVGGIVDSYLSVLRGASQRVRFDLK